MAHEYRGKPDPLPKIPPSLLSAEHLHDYAIKTGMISPYYYEEEGDIEGHKRLKKASYEGRIGKNAYIFNKDDKLERVEISDSFTVPANSIVFAECELNFRIPEYIALRFNLQIRHVHRGLLLGTGPLVDPGYWGKLCIPLHNLTDAPYEIPTDEGLIWIEFTKTTSNLSEGDNPRGVRALAKTLQPEDGLWDIKPFIEKAARPFNGDTTFIPIRSSIPKMVEEANSRSDNALERTKVAEASAIEATEVATHVRNISLAGALAVMFGIFSLWLTFHLGAASQIDSANTRIDRIDGRIDEILERIDDR